MLVRASSWRFLLACLLLSCGGETAGPPALRGFDAPLADGTSGDEAAPEDPTVQGDGAIQPPDAATDPAPEPGPEAEHSEDVLETGQETAQDQMPDPAGEQVDLEDQGEPDEATWQDGVLEDAGPDADPAGETGWASEEASEATAEALPEVDAGCTGPGCPPHELLCRPCVTHLDCAGGACIDQGEAGSFCGTACGDIIPCPDGFQCVERATGQRYCRPADGASCPCTEEARAEQVLQACSRANEHGTCRGVRVCGDPCPVPEPAPEVCNGRDDDCDEVADPEGAPGCALLWLDVDGDGAGLPIDPRCLCAPAGRWLASSGGDCDDGDPGVHPGANERCNGTDEDCDGETDETFLDLGLPCERGVGTCSLRGAMACTPDGSGTVCPVSGAEAGTPCDDGDPCTSGDACSGGEASACAGHPLSCDDGLACTVDACDGDGVCRHVPLPGWCVADGGCVTGGTLHPTTPCLACRPELTGDGWSPVVDGVPCEDGAPCTTGDACKAGVCVPGPPPACSDGVPWTADVCVASGAGYACQHPVTAESCKAGGIWVLEGGQFTPALSNGALTWAPPLGLTCTGTCGAVLGISQSLGYSLPTAAGVAHAGRVRVADIRHNCNQWETPRVLLQQLVGGHWQNLGATWVGAGANTWASIPFSLAAANGGGAAVRVVFANDACCGCHNYCSPNCHPLVSDLNLYVDTVAVAVAPCAAWLP